MAADESLASSLTMYLSDLDINNFRSCQSTSLQFGPTLTLIVGENNAGKSNVIDALRLATSPLSGRRTRYFESEDRSHGYEAEPIEIRATYSGLTPYQQGQFLPCLDLSAKSLTYGTRFTPDDRRKSRGRVDFLAGPALGPDPEPEKRNEINHVYLEPLRNAQRELDSGSGQRLSMIIRYLTDVQDQEGFVESANSSLRMLEEHPVLKNTTTNLQSHLTDLTAPIRQQNVALSFADYKLHRLAKNLRLKMSESGVNLADISESGLGYANLLFIATLILELRNAEDSELTLFLVEEPEAHLHPQLQEVLLSYLQEQAERSTKTDGAQRAGRIQVIATTHSPNLASTVGIENIVVLRSVDVEQPDRVVGSPDEDNNGAAVGAGRVAAGVSGDRAAESSPTLVPGDGTLARTVALPLRNLEISAADRRKINQYLDVTRSGLLFAQKAILIEGIAEAVLLPALADHCLYPGDGEEHRAKRRAVRAASIIAVGSVDFAPYVRLLLQKSNGVRLVDRLVIVTDSDPFLPPVEGISNVEDGSTEAKNAAAAGELPAGHDQEDSIQFNRANKIRELVGQLGSLDALVIAEANYTLEADLMSPIQQNGTILRSAFIAQKPRSASVWDDLAESANPAEAMYRKLRASKKFLAKGQFAHDVASLLQEEGRAFKCPVYLETAINGIVA